MNNEKNFFDEMAEEFLERYIVPVLQNVPELCMSSGELMRQMKTQNAQIGHNICAQAGKYGIISKAQYQNGESVFSFWNAYD